MFVNLSQWVSVVLRRLYIPAISLRGIPEMDSDIIPGAWGIEPGVTTERSNALTTRLHPGTPDFTNYKHVSMRNYQMERSPDSYVYTYTDATLK